MPVGPDTRIERFIARRTARCAVRGPADGAQVRELWFALHGYGQLATEFIDGLRALDDGTRLIVAPEGLSRFYDARSPLERHAEASVGASWMTREDRQDEIADQLAWLQQAHEAFRATVPEGTPLVVLGYSQGTAAASRWVATGAVRPARLVLWGGSVAPELPLGLETPLGRTACTLVVGDRDRFVSPERVSLERDRLDAAGFRYSFERFEGGHRLDDAVLLRLAAVVSGDTDDRVIARRGAATGAPPCVSDS